MKRHITHFDVWNEPGDREFAIKWVGQQALAATTALLEAYKRNNEAEIQWCELRFLTISEWIEENFPADDPP